MRVHFIQHVSFENPGTLAAWAEEAHHTTSYTKIFNGDVFPSADDIDLLIIMGGPMGAYEEGKYKWMKEEKLLIEKTIRAEKKVLGICLGSQLIAEVLGAKVYPHKEKEIGWWPVKKKSENKVTQSLPDEFITFHWHGDTFDLPEGAAHLFYTDVCPNQGFIYKKHVVATQFHMEITKGLMNKMIEHGQDELATSHFIQNETAMREKSGKYLQLQKRYMESFVKNFTEP